ncbi:transmembrane protein 138-like [Pectinophora gossypiella]|uniref:transmembrane protein 138-like n=1 Tax=Pectinophora gossypiella TaxID=13191 RepID=UPI00214F4D0B|nr:transmembrane protein 138-like [Pectinophora gossypiella]
MKLSTPRYTLCLFFQLAFMLCDLIFNCVSLFPRSRDALLVLFIFQDLFLVLSITSLLMTFFSTYLFQAGLVEVLARKFRGAGAACAAYGAASVALHACWLLHAWREPRALARPALVCLFTLQRCLSPWYYFMYKRAALRVSDPRFYEDIDWINRQLQQH